MTDASSNRRSLLLASALILAQSLLYGFGDPISKMAYEVLPVYSLLSARYAIAFVALMVIGNKRVVRGLRSARVSDWLPPSLCIAASYVLSNVALALTDATSVAFLRSMATVMTPLVAVLVLRRRYYLRHLPALVLVIFGTFLLCGMGGLSGFGLGEILTLVAALLMACALVLAERSLGSMDPLSLTTAQAGVSMAMALVCAPLLEGGIHLEAATPLVWAIILYLALTCTLAGFLLQNVALKHATARTIAVVQCSCPVATAAFSFLLLGETLSPLGLLGCAIILVGVIAEPLIPEPESAGSAT